VTPPDDRSPPAAGGEPPWALILGLAAALVAVTLGVLGLFAVRRLPGREPDLLYQGIVRLATRLGYGPRPEQTVYEYTASLSRSVPASTRDLHVVARAKVESTYGGRRGTGSIATLVEAYRRVRLALVRLVLRRGRGPGT
jgi:hypothetical protein